MAISISLKSGLEAEAVKSLAEAALHFLESIGPARFGVITHNCCAWPRFVSVLEGLTGNSMTEVDLPALEALLLVTDQAPSVRHEQHQLIAQSVWTRRAAMPY